MTRVHGLGWDGFVHPAYKQRWTETAYGRDAKERPKARYEYVVTGMGQKPRDLVSDPPRCFPWAAEAPPRGHPTLRVAVPEDSAAAAQSGRSSDIPESEPPSPGNAAAKAESR